MTQTHPSLNQEEEPRPDPLNESERPLSSHSVAWPAYWKSQGQPWRTEPEIAADRQEQLDVCRSIPPDVKQGIYPFKGKRLSRADIEWLLATHENGKGPIDWQDKAQQRREGLDLRGAILSGDAGQSTDLRGLPLARIQGGLSRGEWSGWARASQEFLAMSAIDLQAADLFGTHLEGASLIGAQLNRADLRLAGLEGANLTGAQLEGANLTGAQLEGANLTGAQLEGAYLTGAQLLKANLHRAQLKQAILFGTQLKDAYLVGAQLEGANFTGAQLGGANLRQAMLGRAVLSGTTLEETDLAGATLVDANGVGPRLEAVRWGNTDLSAVDWLQIKQLDDEYVIQQNQGEPQDALTQLQACKKAVKASRQLALALRAQSLYEEAAHFSYQAHVLQREVLRRQIASRKPGKARDSWLSQMSKYLFSLFLHLTTGYGYKPWRSIVTYIFCILIFALAYAYLGHVLLLPDALVLSLTGFHGRGFYPDQASASTFMVLMALEAVVGLLLEITYIIVFAKRFLEQ